MDTTLLGVLVGSGLVLLGNFIGQWFSMRKEEKNWQRQQKAESEKYERETKEINKKAIRDTYHNCINSLSLLIATDSVKKTVNIPDDEQFEHYKDAYKWLTLVALHNRNNGNKSSNDLFYRELKHFSERGAIVTAAYLRDMVMDFAMKDPILFPDAPILLEDEDISGRMISIDIDQEFRRLQFMDGIELPSRYEFSVLFEDLTSEQRSKIWQLYINSVGKIPEKLNSLYLPTYNEKNSKTTLRGKSWRAQINPLELDPTEIISAWEIEYEKMLEEIQSQINASSENS